jgi:hypothetical protein
MKKSELKIIAEIEKCVPPKREIKGDHTNSVFSSGFNDSVDITNSNIEKLKGEL